ncbi:hypothetical protein CKO31_18755 [Thiohalocapsa halophila]|uniref:Uncharacterized protein n=1 Tax=Thiohalocapsa halophila TaxID=69359 RepID=A0ABS1CLE3_9GAMM|nr:hypothetical protein [Thiohalocapsa halophila]MBK1632748.1 hypothetical protein [Thiohalocapsa halophila]
MTKRAHHLIIGLVILFAGLMLWLTPPPLNTPAPPVPRLADPDSREIRARSPLDLLEWGRDPTPLFLVSVPEDVLPNGLALSMVPFFVDWERSLLDGPFAQVRLRNVSVGGNPTAGENLLGTVQIPLRGVTDVQWCLTPDRNAKGKDTAMGHAQLRFVFAEDAQPVVLGRDGRPQRLLRPLDDLVLSWEAWRPPRTRYDPIAGMDPETYALTARAYSGRTRWLGDALRGNPWRCYPLRLPATGDAAATVLMTGLLMGDALARRTVAAMVERGDLELPGAEALTDFTPADKDAVVAAFSTSALPDDPLTHLMGEAELSYQLLERSCITYSLGVIQLALLRLHAAHDLGPAPRLDIVPRDLPPWVADLATAETGELLGYLPGALLFLARNGQVIPGNAYRILDDAGLLHEQDGLPLVYEYFFDERTPYGDLRDNLM